MTFSIPSMGNIEDFVQIYPLIVSSRIFAIQNIFCTHKDRGFTVREAARLQGFPDEFIFHGPERSQAQQVGNAVPPPMAAVLATWIREMLN